MSCIAYVEENDHDFDNFEKCVENITGGLELVRCRSVLEVLDFVVDNKTEVVMVSAKAKEIGMENFVKVLRRVDSEISVVVVSDDKKDAYEAMQLKMDGFLLKPIVEDNVLNVISCLSERLCTVPLQNFGSQKDIRMCTMPKFNMFVNGEPVVFKRKKGKELMAFMVNAEGTIVNVEMIVKALWPGEQIGSSQRNRCRVLVNCLKNFLKGLGLDELLVTANGQYYLSKKLYSCDVDELFQGDKQAIRKYGNYDGHYMEEYDWAQGRKVGIDRYLKDVSRKEKK